MSTGPSPAQSSILRRCTENELHQSFATRVSAVQEQVLALARPSGNKQAEHFAFRHMRGFVSRCRERTRGLCGHRRAGATTNVVRIEHIK